MPLTGAGPTNARRGDDPAPSVVFGDDQAPSRETQVLAWMILVIAGLFEIGRAVGLKFTPGFSKPLPIALKAVSPALRLGLLGGAVRTLPPGTA